MKTDVEYSNIYICPVTKDLLTNSDMYNHDGTCVKCGHNGRYISHYKKIPGRKVRPSLIERIFYGKKTEFMRKEDEDKIMKALSQ